MDTNKVSNLFSHTKDNDLKLLISRPPHPPKVKIAQALYFQYHQNLSN